MKQIIMIVLMLGLLGLVSATYAGETLTIDLSGELESYNNYMINGNTSAINISMENLICTIQIPADYIPGEFEIIFNGTKANKVVEYVYVGGSGGGGSRTRTIYKNNTITKEVEKIVYQNNSEPINGDLVNPVNKNYYWVLIPVFFILLFALIIIFKKVKD